MSNAFLHQAPHFISLPLRTTLSVFSKSPSPSLSNRCRIISSGTCHQLLFHHRKLCGFAGFAVSKTSLFSDNQYLTELVKSKRIDDARKKFDTMPKRDEFTWNTMISGYADSGLLVHAHEVFVKAPNKSFTSWSSLLSGYCKYGFEDDAFQLFWQMLYEGHIHSQFTLSNVLRICCVKGLLLKGEQIHGYAVKTNYDTNPFVRTGLIDMYAKCSRLTEAEFLFFMMSGGRNHVTWTAMINGYALNRDSVSAVECFGCMRAEGVEANQYTFPGVLTACGAICDIRSGVQVHCCIVREGFEANIFVQSAIIDMYAKCREFDSAERSLRSMELDHVVSWNSLIVGYVMHGLEDKALSLFRIMHERNMELDGFTYPSVLNCLASQTYVKTGNMVHGLIIKTGFEDCNPVCNALVNMYAKQGDSKSSFEIFKRISDKDVITWTSAITGCAHNEFHEEALSLFCKMRASGIEPDLIVTSSILSTSAELTLLGFGRQVQANYIKCHAETSLSVNNSLVTLYVNCGCLEEANSIFNLMQNRNVITWTALIVGYAKNGEGHKAIGLYDEMIASGTKPDFITFIGLLFACSHAGLVEQGQAYFESMIHVYGISPVPDHYACMIDLLGRSGKMQEAEKLIKEMVVEPDATVWKALLAACRIHGSVDLAKKASRALLDLTPRDAAPYIMLSNIYSATGHWNDAAVLRKEMKVKRITKETGSSWIEVNGKVHNFMSEDRSHPKADEIYSKIEVVMVLIKEAGYVPDMRFSLHDVNEEAKEKGLAYHSEKLALAFGLLYVPQGAPIRIYKNLRVCGDCHSAMKFISKIFSRHVVLRDSNRFHHFKDGNCSCGDYY